ncbi:TerB family tellurite resistance protein [candidate division KSB1 bacterium]
MPSQQLVMNLSKLMIAAAWVDGNLDNEEVNALKDLLFNFPELTEREWTILNMYFDSPVSGEDASLLLEHVLDEIKTDDDKRFVIDSLTALVHADGRITSEEAEMLEDIKAAVEDRKTGFMSQFGGIMGGAVKKRRNGYRQGTQREDRIEDYIKNTIYFQLVSVVETAGMSIEIPEEQLRKLCLAAGLMARVACVDESLDDDEKLIIKDILHKEWGLPENESLLVSLLSCSKVIKGLDFFRLSRSFYESTTLEERKKFLRSLFLVANSSEKTSHKEIEEIRSIANHLLLEHKDFIDAKLSVSDGDRGGL